MAHTGGMGWGQSVLALGIVCVLGGGLAGCAAIRSGQCVDHVSMTAAEQAQQSSLIVDADVRSTDRTVEASGRYRVYEAAITDVRKGRTLGDRIEVIATSDQCTSSGQPVEYVDGDPLAEPGSYRLYLTRVRGGGPWQLVVPGAAERLPA
jgi:hypothetical protein